jgi:LCP family protein required for cell wall assembly
MANDDWNLDDYLDFHYDRETEAPEPDNEFEVFDKLVESNKEPEVRRGLDDSFDSYEEIKRYNESRHRREAIEQGGQSAPDYGAHYSWKSDIEPPMHRDYPAPEPVRHEPVHSEPVYQQPVYNEPVQQEPVYQQPVYNEPAYNEPSRRAPDEVDDFLFDNAGASGAEAPRAPQEVPDDRKIHSAKELEAIKQASQDAYERYRSNYVRNKAKRVGASQLSKAQRILMGVYGVSLASFAVSMGLMNVLPAGMLIALYVILGLLTLLIFAQIKRRTFQVWAKRLATALAVVLIFVYGMGTAYAMGTLSFLSTTSVDNEDSVTNITKDPFNVVITGMDVDGTIDTQGRSDVNMLLTVNPKTAQILMTSIPRDYEIHMPDKDYATDKLTHTGFYSVQTTILAEEDLLGIDANYYVKVNFSTVEKFIDAIGGVDVYSEYEFTPVKKKDWTVQEGMNHMDGEQALAFARERKAFPSGDNQRIKNQQAVFEAMFKKATSSRTMLLSYNKILSNLKDYFEMSFSSRELRALVKMQLAKNPNWQIYKNTIVGGNGSMTTYTTGDQYCYVMTQDADSIENAKTLINAVMTGQPLEKDEDGNVYVVQTEDSEETSE